MSRPCVVGVDCHGDYYGRGLCSRHYGQWREGRLTVPEHLTRTEAEPEEPWLCECAHPDMDDFTPGMCRTCLRLHRDHLSPANRRALEDKERSCPDCGFLDAGSAGLELGPTSKNSRTA
jgi:hypothetical protein